MTQVNNAGRSQRGLAEKTDIKVDQDLFHLNVISQISLTKSLLPHFIERQSGHIMVTSSVAGVFGSPCSATYSASKHAMQGYFRSLEAEVKDYGIFVTLACPGPVVSNVRYRGNTPPVFVRRQPGAWAPGTTCAHAKSKISMFMGTCTILHPMRWC